MTSTEDNQTRRQRDQANMDALMSDDAARAIEILYRSVAHGIPVPDPEVVATLAVQPKHPARAFRRHTWIRTTVPLALGLAAIVGSLGWSYADYNDRQQEWQRIAEEQTTLANQREALANERAILLKQSEDARAQLIAREVRSQEIRRRQIDRVQKAQANGDVCGAIIVWTNLADDIMSNNVDDKVVLRELVQTIDQVIRDSKATPHGSP